MGCLDECPELAPGIFTSQKKTTAEKRSPNKSIAPGDGL
jgi:hypothetical protein